MKRMIYLIIFLFIISFVNAYEIEYIHQDHLGNNIAITNEEGDVIWKADYEPFGSSFNEKGDNNKKYNNKEEDNTKLLYYGARYYDKDIGRFTTPDPISGSITDPQTLNRYVYVKNNPMKYIDPTGNRPIDFGYLVLADKIYTVSSLSKIENEIMGELYGLNYQVEKKLAI